MKLLGEEKNRNFNPVDSLKKHVKSGLMDAFLLIKSQNALNFETGAPDVETPDLLKNAINLASRAIQTLQNPIEHAESFLNKQMAISVSKQLGIELDPTKHVVNHNGATSIFNAFVRSFLQKGDEVILVQPSYLWYPALYNHQITIKFTKNLIDEDNVKKAEIDYTHMRSLVTKTTKFLIFINPGNPDGRVWTRRELMELAKIAEENPHISVLSDEVYCRHVFDKKEFIPFASLQGMFHRTITMYSFGKVFYCTGWRVGGASGPEHLIAPLKKFISENTDGVNVLAKMAIGYALKLADQRYKGFNSYYEWNIDDFQKRRDKVASILRKTKICEFDIIESNGTYTFAVSIKKIIKLVPMKYFYMLNGIPSSETRDKISSFEEFKTLKNPDVTCDLAVNNYFIFELGVGFMPGVSFYYNTDSEKIDHNGATNEDRNSML